MKKRVFTKEKSNMSEYNICEPCLREGSNVTATVYCQDCLEIMCEDCKRHHLKHTPSANHKTLDIIENKIQVSDLEDIRKSSRCPSHVTEEVKYLCKNHHELCCNQCALVTHRKCEQLVSLADEVKNFKSGVGMKACLTEIDKHINILIKHEQSNKDKSELSVDEAKEILKRLKTQIDETYAKLENEILDKLTKGSKETIEGSNSQQGRLTEVKDDIKQSLDSLEFASKFGQDVHYYLVEKKLKEEYRQKEEAVRKLQRRSSRKRVELTENIPEKELLDKLFNCICADEVVENFDLPQCPGTTDPKTREAVLIKEIDVGHGQSFPKHCIWIGQYVIVALAKERLLISIDSDSGSCLAKYNCPYDVREMTTLEGSTFAVFCLDAEIIKVSKSHFQHLRTVNSNSLFGGIAYNRSEKQLLVSSYGDGTLERINFDGTHAGNMNLSNRAQEVLKQSTNIAFDNANKRLYISDILGDEIWAVDNNGNILFTYSHKHLDGACSIAFDYDSNIYVVSRNGNCIQQVDRNGVFIKDLITISNGSIRKPHGICFTDQNTRLAVTCEGEKQLKIFSFE